MVLEFLDSNSSSYVSANVIAAMASFILFWALWILPDRLYKDLLRPYRHLFILVAVALLNDSIRKVVGVCYMYHYAPFWMLNLFSWTTALVGCAAIGFFIPVFRKIGILNYMEDVRREAHLKYRAVFDAAADSIINTTGDGLVVDLNLSATQTFGYTLEEVLGNPFTIMIAERYRARYEKTIKAFIGGDKTIMPHRVRIEGLRKDGSEFPLELSMAHYVINTKVYFTAILRDISLRASLEKENAELKEAKFVQETH